MEWEEVAGCTPSPNQTENLMLGTVGNPLSLRKLY